MTTTDDRLNSPLLDRFGPEVTSAYEQSRREQDEAASLRREIEKLDTPVRDLEERVGSKAVKGRRRKALLADLVEALRRSTELAARVHRRETDSLGHLREAVGHVRRAVKGKKVELPPRTVEGLERVLRLRASEVEWLDGVIQHSRRAAALPASSSADEVVAILEQRRSCMDRVGSLRAEAETLERVVLGLPALNSTVGNGQQPNGDAGFNREDWNTWLDQFTSGDGDAEGSDPPPVSETLARRFELLEREIRDIRQLAERERDEFARETNERIRRLEETSAEALAEKAEERRRAKEESSRLQTELGELRTRLEEAESGREETLALLSKKEEELSGSQEALEKAVSEAQAREAELVDEKQSIESDLRSKIEELDAAATRAEAEHGDRVRELEGKMKDLENRLDHAEEAEKEAAEKLAAETKGIQEERARLEQEHEKSQAELEAANQERDEALALIGSLTKRLGTPSLPEEAEGA
jgi:chromosome segregation ATPase